MLPLFFIKSLKLVRISTQTFPGDTIKVFWPDGHVAVGIDAHIEDLKKTTSNRKDV
jgi:hypothetical protein